jgi:ribosomal protein S18 acetylase RimI-like enzyme
MLSTPASTRPEQPDDEPFLHSLITESIAESQKASLWPDVIRDTVLDFQFRARRHSVVAGYPDGESLVILCRDEPVGWLFVASGADEIRLVEIVIRSSRRSQGIGAALIRDLMARAELLRLPLRLSVDIANTRAFSLYLRLGFRREDGDEARNFLVFTPAVP